MKKLVKTSLWKILLHIFNHICFHNALFRLWRQTLLCRLHNEYITTLPVISMGWLIADLSGGNENLTNCFPRRTRYTWHANACMRAEMKEVTAMNVDRVKDLTVIKNYLDNKFST